MECKVFNELMTIIEMHKDWNPPGAQKDRKRRIKEHKENCVVCSGKYEIVSLVEFRAHNKKENPMVTLDAVKQSDGYYFLTYENQIGGYLGKTKHAAADALRDGWGSWIDFKSLIGKDDNQ